LAACEGFWSGCGGERWGEGSEEGVEVGDGFKEGGAVSVLERGGPVVVVGVGGVGEIEGPGFGKVVVCFVRGEGGVLVAVRMGL